MQFSQEHRDISVKAIALGTVIVSVVSILYVLLAWGLDARGARPAPTPWPTIPDEVNQIEVARFAEPTAAERKNVSAREWLEQYGWVDREAGVIRLPIDTAVEIYLARIRKESP